MCVLKDLHSFPCIRVIWEPKKESQYPAGKQFWILVGIIGAECNDKDVSAGT